MDPSPRLSSLSLDKESFNAFILATAWSQTVLQHLPNSVIATLPRPIEKIIFYGQAGMLRLTSNRLASWCSAQIDHAMRVPYRPLQLTRATKLSVQDRLITPRETELKEFNYGN